MNQNFDKDRLIELVGQLFDRKIGEEDLAELETTLKQHKQARELYHLTVSLHRDLESCEIGGADVTTVTVATTDVATLARALNPQSGDGSYATRQRRVVVTLALAASILLVVSMIGFYAFRGDNDPTQPTIVATVSDLIDVEWAEGQTEIKLGDELPAQRLKLTAGTVFLTYKHGVVVTIEGPADFELQTKDHAILHEGQLVAYVPDGAEGFRVSTDSTDVVDLGTEFGITARQDGSSDVNSPQSTRQRVVAGLAYRVDRDGTTSQEEYRQSRFEEARSIIRRRKFIREPFRKDELFPGEAKNGWTGPWSLDSENFAIDEEATGIHEEEPLVPGTRNYLTVVARSESSDEAGRLRLRKSPEIDSRFQRLSGMAV